MEESQSLLENLANDDYGLTYSEGSDSNKSHDTDRFYLENPKVLYDGNNYVKFIPTQNMNYIEKLNSLVRLSIYLFLALFLLGKNDKKNISWFYIPIILFLGVNLFYAIDKKEKGLAQENEERKIKLEISKPKLTPEETYLNDKNSNETCTSYQGTKCRKPTPNNPFMNVLLTDYIEDSDRPPACNIENSNISNLAYDGFVEGLFQDVTDVFEKKNSDRTYYSMPSTTIPNDTISFAKWCAGIPETCKTNNQYCYGLANNDPRQGSRKEFFYD